MVTSATLRFLICTALPALHAATRLWQDAGDAAASTPNISGGGEGVSHGFTNGRKAMSLLRQRWDWGTAFGELATEWGIVLRRQYLVDMELASLIMKFSEALPVNPTSGARQEAGVEELEGLRANIRKLATELVVAAKDQETSDDTFTDMEVDTNLTAPQKQALDAEHYKAVRRAQELVDLGQKAHEDAEALFVHLEQHRGVNATEPGAGQRGARKAAAALRNGSGRGGRAAPIAAATVGISHLASPAAATASAARLFAEFKAASDAFRGRRDAFEKEMRAAKSRLLALSGGITKVVLPVF